MPIFFNKKNENSQYCNTFYNSMKNDRNSKYNIPNNISAEDINFNPKEGKKIKEYSESQNKIFYENEISKILKDDIILKNESVQKESDNHKKNNFNEDFKRDYNYDVKKTNKNPDNNPIEKNTHNNFKKVDNTGLEYFKVNSKSNNFQTFLNKRSNNQDTKKPLESLKKNLGPICENERNESKSLFESLKAHGYEYKNLIKEAFDQRNKLSQLVPNSNIISKHMNKSDIFFNKDSSHDEKNLTQLFNKSSISPIKIRNLDKFRFYNTSNIVKMENHKYKDSDIFQVKNNSISLNKIGEKHLFREYKDYINKKNNITCTSRSNSEWGPKNNVISLMNHESTNYDFFNPLIKKKFFTKEKVISLANGFNPNKIQKSISEISDLTRVAYPNFNKDFKKAFENDSTIFRKKMSVCDSFNNLYKEYENLCNKPFVKN